jgi:predicted nucleic acid-binding protein
VKLVVDTNTLVSGFLWDGVPAQLLNFAFTGSAHLFVTEPLLRELENTLLRLKFAARLAAKARLPHDWSPNTDSPPPW